jgi:Zn finger protein HypA/HybF involved in hydrogenase expression
MAQRSIDPTRLDEDWEGNNIAVTCPACSKVFIVSGMLHDGKRDCPKCGKSTGTLEGGRKSGGTAIIKW